MGLDVFLRAAQWLATFRGIVVPFSLVSSRPSFSGSGWVIAIRLDDGLSKVFRNAWNFKPTDKAQTCQQHICAEPRYRTKQQSNLLGCTES
jgi:hypothetical protein